MDCERVPFGSLTELISEAQSLRGMQFAADLFHDNFGGIIKTKEVSMMRIALLFLAGGFGCLARFALTGLVQRIYGGELPIGTLFVNLIGSLLFGFVWTLSDERLIISGETRFLILTGFMASFTTFSTLAFETSALLRDAEWWIAAGNVLVHVIVGILAVIVGMALGRIL